MVGEFGAVGCGVGCIFVANAINSVVEALGKTVDKIAGGGLMVES